MATPSSSIQSIAARLDTAWRTKTPIPPVSETDGVDGVSTAYAIQSQWADMRLERGEKIVGRKIGLTSKAVQQQLGVAEPDYGALWQSSFYEAKGGQVSMPASDFLQPRIEGEVAFLIGKPLRGPQVTPEQVLAATDACALGIEIVASRIHSTASVVSRAPCGTNRPPPPCTEPRRRPSSPAGNATTPKRIRGAFWAMDRKSHGPV